MAAKGKFGIEHLTGYIDRVMFFGERIRSAKIERFVYSVMAGAALLLAAGHLFAATGSVQGVWLGQDGHDYCQTARSIGSNDIQDLHIRLEGLPPAEIRGLFVRREGGGEWAWGKAGGPWTWKAHLIRKSGESSADVFMEPSHTEASFRVTAEVTFEDGSAARFPIACGESNPNLFMPGANIAARWMGQDGQDWTGADAAVGPDGVEDACIELTGISRKLALSSVVVESGGAILCEYGLNPNRHPNAELIRDPKDKTRGRLFFSPQSDLEGRQLNIRATYEIARSNAVMVVAGATNPRRRIPVVAPAPFAERALKVEWLGQDGAGPQRGDIHLRVHGLGANEQVEAAALSDKVGGFWTYLRQGKMTAASRAEDEISADKLIMRRAERALDIFFAPFRDERETPMWLRLRLEDGTASMHAFAGGACDAYLRGALPETSVREARPGDDLNRLVMQAGKLRLAAGEYVMERPLKLLKPIEIVGDRSAVLRFVQGANDQPWRGAVLIAAPNVTLRGFTIRCSDDFRWTLHESGGAAIVRTVTEHAREPLANIVLADLDIVSPDVTLPTDPSKAIETPHMVRLAEAVSGKIIGNRFRGGTVDVNNGPWEIRGNEHRGTPPGTVAWDAFGGHWLHDYTLEGNRVHAERPSGKIWRFISMNQLGQRIVIRSNDVSGVGMRDTDKLPNPNAPEILLTESYRLSFEGKPSWMSADGRVIRVPRILYGAVRPGSVVSILSGPHAGEYAVVAQPLSATEFYMADPLPPGDYAISVAHGFCDDVIDGNRIDVRGGKSAVVVLAGNHWGLKLINNHLLGGGDSMLIQSTPTEDPFIWGWSHTPFMGFVAENNVSEESWRGVSIDVYSDKHSKSGAGRTYMSGVFQGNAVRVTGTNAAAVRAGGHSNEADGRMRVEIESWRGQDQEAAKR